jgi:anti-anti-sigma factor
MTKEQTMAFNASLEQHDGAAIITLSGELDASVQQVFRDQIEKAAAQNPQRLVLMMQDLQYMSSAGLRALIYARQKMGNDVDIYIVGAPEGIVETLEMTGFSNSVIMLDQYDAAQIEHG